MTVRIALFFIAAATLMLELLLTRVFDVILTPNLAYMVIACAMFSFGLAGVYVALRPPPPSVSFRHRLAVLAGLFSAAALALMPALNWLPFNYEVISEQPVVQLLAFAGMYLALVVPFFLSGLIFTLLFSTSARSIQGLYFWDLAGAAVGCVLMVPLLIPIGPGGLLFLVTAFGLIGSGLMAGDRRWLAACVAGAALLVLVPAVRSPAYFEFVEHVEKRGVKEARLAGTIEFSRWDPISKIDVIDQTNTEPDLEQGELYVRRRKHVAYDGGTQSSHIFQFDGDYERLRREIESGTAKLREHFWHRAVLASHHAKRDSGQRVLILGSAAGQETKAALMYGAAAVDGVEMVGTVVEFMTGRYAEYSGHVLDNPRVRVHVAEGRGFLRASDERYDIIQIHSNHTSSSIAAGTGAMAPNYLQTADAYREYFSHLSRDGLLHINHFGFGRMITTAALAWRQMGRTDFQRHVLVYGMTTQYDTLPTLLVRMQPWTREQVADLSAFFAQAGEDEVGFQLLQDPLDPAASFLPPELFSGRPSDELLQRAGVHLRAATDDQPFFNLIRKRFGPMEPDAARFVDLGTATMLNSQLRRGWVPMDLIHLIVTGVVSLCFAVVFIVLPLRRSRIRHAAATVKYLSMIYFSSLGAGFILFELVFIQIFMKLIGYPVYTYVLVISTMLLGAGIGSAASRGLGISPDTRWPWPFVGVLAYGGVFALTYPMVFDYVLAWPEAARMAAAGALVFPLGFVLGIPFPLGVLMAERHSREAVAWGWGLNGLFTVIGSLASVVLGITIGFQAALLVAVGIYAAAFLAFSGLRVATADAQTALSARELAVSAIGASHP